MTYILEFKSMRLLMSRKVLAACLALFFGFANGVGPAQCQTLKRVVLKWNGNPGEVHRVFATGSFNGRTCAVMVNGPVTGGSSSLRWILAMATRSWSTKSWMFFVSRCSLCMRQTRSMMALRVVKHWLWVGCGA
jgi:hypothetical protein